MLQDMHAHHYDLERLLKVTKHTKEEGRQKESERERESTKPNSFRPS